LDISSSSVNDNVQDVFSRHGVVFTQFIPDGESNKGEMRREFAIVANNQTMLTKT